MEENGVVKKVDVVYCFEVFLYFYFVILIRNIMIIF